MTPLLELSPAPGELVRFQVPGADEAPSAVSPAPLSYVQENHVRRLLANRAAGRAQSAWVGIMYDVPGRLDTDAMAAALNRWVLRHPTLLTWFSLQEGEEGEGGSGIVRRVVDPSAVAVEAASLGPYDSPDAIRDWLLELFDTGTDPLNWPPFVVGSVVRDDVSTVYYAVDHCHSDGLSALLVFSELRALYEAEVAGTVAELPPAGSYVDFCALERERSALLTADSPEVHRWLEFFRAGPPPTFPLDLGTEPGATYPKLSLSVDLLDAAETDAFAKVCRTHGAGFSAGVLGALGISGYELGGHRTYRALSVVHTRDEPRWLLSQGWFINLVPVQFPVAPAGSETTAGTEATPADTEPTLADILAGARTAFARARELAGVSPVRVAELVPGLAVQPGAGAVLPMVSYIDLRHAPGSKDWAEANCHGLAGPGTSTDVPIWVNRLWDRTYVKVTYPDTAAARENVPRFLERLRDVLREIARSGEYRVRATGD
ncbi:condensation domain-containing protein [Streptomyces sp. NPDC101062]|uniref:condensation domain-containing protein n=1 Tax=unclassified Streptomyces TaxID=2593676 RepID=UPI002E75E27B|nr:condensation domain-containing protein [Streptomyces sp. JV176]MEE1802894.1 condensation domain-containing protein [Streptomyces sp. JV176]